MYLFIYQAASSLSFAGSSLCHVESFVVVHGLSSCGMWAAEHAGSVTVRHRLGCSVSCGILAPWPVIKCMSLPCKVDSQLLSPQGSPRKLNMFFCACDFVCVCVCVWVILYPATLLNLFISPNRNGVCVCVCVCVCVWALEFSTYKIISSTNIFFFFSNFDFFKFIFLPNYSG